MRVRLGPLAALTAVTALVVPACATIRGTSNDAADDLTLPISECAIVLVDDEAAVLPEFATSVPEEVRAISRDMGDREGDGQIRGDWDVAFRVRSDLVGGGRCHGVAGFPMSQLVMVLEGTKRLDAPRTYLGVIRHERERAYTTLVVNGLALPINRSG